MLRRGLLLAVLVAVVSLSAAGKLPPNIKRCARSDPNVQECFRDAVEDALPKLKQGLPKLGVGPLDPLIISEMRLSQGNSNGPIRLDLSFANMTTVNVLEGIKVKSAFLDIDKMVIEVDTLAPHVTANSKYSVSGQILLLPITGTGDSRVDLYDLNTKIKLSGKLIKKADGKDYVDVTDCEAKLMPKKMVLHMDNLFNGDKQLGDTMNRVLSENWELLFNELGPSLNLAYAELFKRPARALFMHVPYESILPEKL